MSLASNMTTGVCSPQAIPFPSVFGTQLLNFEANTIANFSAVIAEGQYVNHGAVTLDNASFCNVTFSYTHPGQNDSIITQVFLPSDNWNNRMQGVGGGGFQAGGSLYPFTIAEMIGAVGLGYVAVNTDAGHESENPVNWALVSPGNLNLPLLQDFAHVALGEAAVFGKAIAESFYGQKPKKSYWSGCSQGGRQGYLLAQRYPEAYDGIVASAPAISTQFLLSDYYPQWIMNQLGEYPHICEFTAITAAAVKACDELDGVKDQMIGEPDLCKFSPFSVVGKEITCAETNTTIKISEAAATVVNASWSGLTNSDGTFAWYGMEKEALLTGPFATLNTECSANGNCTGAPLSLATDFIRLFLEKNVDYDFSKTMHKDLDRWVRQTRQDYKHASLSADDPDLSAFKAAGGKLITYHGLADYIIPPRGSETYYKAVTALDPNVHDYYRLFLSPGLEHCFNGTGGYPSGIFQSMVEWVEEGKVPDSLDSHQMFPDADGKVKTRLLCPYPQKAKYTGQGSTDDSGSYRCE